MLFRSIDHLKDAFLFSESKRYDVKGKHYFDYPNKYYCEDVGLRNARLNFRQYEPSHIMENIVYNELRRRSYNVDVGVVEVRQKSDEGKDVRNQLEIDFVANKGSERVYIQSALNMDSDKKTESELNSLLLTKDFFKKIVIRMDISHNFYDANGIYHCNLIDFLLNNQDLF